MQNESCDIAVIGAGPAGSMAALHAARLGRSVCLLDRSEKVGSPVRCGEGIGYKSFVNHVGARTEWTLNKVEKAAMVSPSGIKVAIGNIDESFILDRAKMDADLAAEAAAAGAKLFLSTTVTDITRTNDGRYECRIGTDRAVIAQCVIIADGVESRCARFLGWNTAVALKDIETCAFCHVASPLIDSDTCVFYTGTTHAPGGYAWIFPRGKGIANVIRNDSISGSLIRYDSYIRNTLRSQEDFSQDMLQNLLHIQNEIFDSEIIESNFINKSTGNFEQLLKKINPAQNDLLFKYYNEIFLYKSIIYYIIISETRLKQQANALIELIKRSYHLK